MIIMYDFYFFKFMKTFFEIKLMVRLLKIGYVFRREFHLTSLYVI